MARWLGFGVALVAAMLVVGCEDQQDWAAHEQFNSRLAAKQRGEAFPMRDLVPGNWTMMWAFGGYTTPDDMEKAVGREWDDAHEVAEGAYVIVIAGPGETVRGFDFDPPSGIFNSCLPRTPIKPTDLFRLIGPVEGEGPGSNYLARDGGACGRPD